MTMDTELELRLRDWLRADAAAVAVPGGLRASVLDIPSAPARRDAWWQRFATLPAIGAGVSAAVVAAIVVTSLFFNLFDAPAGADGEACNTRQVQRALEGLAVADGYRVMSREYLRFLAAGDEIDFENPQYTWTEAWVSEGAYLAPDRHHDRMIFRLEGRYDRGYLEHLQVDGGTYQLQEIEGEVAWIERENWPTANPVMGYLANAFNSPIGVPGVASLDWRGTPPPDLLPGEAGCTAAAIIPNPESPMDVTIPPHLVRRQAIAVRVDASDGRLMAAYIGPAVDAIQRDGDLATTWELTWTLPGAEEFVAPTQTVPDPNFGTGQTPPPTPTLPPPDPDAWIPLELPSDSGGLVADVAIGDRYVAVGGRWGADGARGLVWTSVDGIGWEVVAQAFPDVDLTAVAWDGTRYMAVAHRADEEGANVYPESWTSADGLSWEPGGPIGPLPGSGEVANPSGLLTAGPRWLLGGSIWSLADNQQRPAFFTSADGVIWETVELRDVGSGSLGHLVELPDGTLFATGCEEPGGTNSGAFGASCLMRPWHSDDGESWVPGPVFGLELSGIGRWGERLIGLSPTGNPYDDPSATTKVMVSEDDGSAWTELSMIPGEGVSAGRVHVLDDELVVDGQHGFGGTFPIAAAWRSPDGVSWEPIALGLPDGAIGSGVAGVHVADDGRLVVTGYVWMSETDTRPVVWIEP